MSIPEISGGSIPGSPLKPEKPKNQKKITDFFSKSIGSENKPTASSAPSALINSSDIPVTEDKNHLEAGISSLATSASSSVRKSLNSLNSTAITFCDHGGISRPTSESLLKPGSYLVRNSSISDFKVFSCKLPDGKIFHILFKQENGEIQTYDGAKEKGKTCSTIQELATSLNLNTAIPSYDHGELSRTDSETLLKPASFLVRNSSIPNFKVFSCKLTDGKIFHILFKEENGGIQTYNQAQEKTKTYSTIQEWATSLELEQLAKT